MVEKGSMERQEIVGLILTEWAATDSLRLMFWFVLNIGPRVVVVMLGIAGRSSDEP